MRPPLDAFAGPALAVGLTVAVALIVALAVDVVRILRVKREATVLEGLPLRSARLGVSERVSSPTTIGYRHPAVLVPSDFRARVDDGEWDAVVAHECAHLARADDWGKALQNGVCRLGWWLPGLWILGRALDLEREVASDERAAQGRDPRAYAACLLRLATEQRPDLAPAFSSRRSQLAIRVERLLQPSSGAPRPVRAAGIAAFSGVAAAALAGTIAVVPPAGHRRAPRVPAVVALRSPAPKAQRASTSGGGAVHEAIFLRLTDPVAP